jgi:hypothetical protein
MVDGQVEGVATELLVEDESLVDAQQRPDIAIAVGRSQRLRRREQCGILNLDTAFTLHTEAGPAQVGGIDIQRKAQPLRLGQQIVAKDRQEPG